MVPTQFHRLLALPEDVRDQYDLSSLRHMIHAAAPCPVDMKHAMIEWWGAGHRRVLRRLRGRRHHRQHRGVAGEAGHRGQAWPISEIAIFDDDGNRLEGPTRSAPSTWPCRPGDFEYHKDKEKTQKNRIGKFFTVGDVGLLDEDGYLFLRDRKIDMIISGGANIYPAEIENVLLGHPKVVDAAVFGIPHDDWGEEVKAVVEPADGVEASPELAAEILAYCCEAVWPSSRRPSRSTSPTTCPGTPTASSTSASSATPTGKGARRSDPSAGSPRTSGPGRTGGR